MDVRQILANAYALVLAPRPGDETARFGSLITAACRAGLPPVVMVLTDGSSRGEGPAQAVADRHERATRAAAAALGLDDERLIMAGMVDGTLPAPGEPAWDAVVHAIDHVAWRTDCRTLIVPQGGDGLDAMVRALAQAVVQRTGLRAIELA